MGKIVDSQTYLSTILSKALYYCKNCNQPLLMFGCDNPRCENYHKNKRFFYHEKIKTQEEIDNQEINLNN